MMEKCDIALIQEPWIHQGKIKGLGGAGGDIVYCRSTQSPRTCIYIKRGIQFLPLVEHCSRDAVAIKVLVTREGLSREIILGSIYLPYDEQELPPTKELKDLISSGRANGSHLILGCDANAHHTLWGSTDINPRGEALLQFIMEYNLDILNVGNKPTFVNSRRKEVLDITLATNLVSEQVSDWKVSDEISGSDHRFICFKINGLGYTTEKYRNPRKANWESYRTDLDSNLEGTTDRITNVVELERAVDELQSAIMTAYNENTPLVIRETNRKVVWWSTDLKCKRAEVRKLFNKAMKTGRWEEHRRVLTEYNKAVRLAKRNSWRKHCEDIESTPECARLHKILSKNDSPVISNLETSDGKYTNSGSDTLKELFRVHFPGSTIIEEPHRGCQNQDLNAPFKRANRDDWTVAKKVVTYDKVKWAIETFEPYKSAGPDEIIPIMLQQGTTLLVRKLTLVLRASLALGHIPMRWRRVRVVYIPKPGRNSSQAKSFRPISLMSFVLKTLEKLIDRHVRDGILNEYPVSEDQYAYKLGSSTETALFQVVKRLESALDNKEIALATFIDIEGAFDNTSFRSLNAAVRERGLNETCCKWIQAMLKDRTVHSTLLGETLSAKVGGGCPQGGNLSPLLWNLVIDGLLRSLRREGYHVYGYADDIVIIVVGKYPNIVRQLMQRALNIVARWVQVQGLNVSANKTALVPFTRKRNLDGLQPLVLKGERLKIVGEAKYLGVILDAKLTWNQQIEKISNKALTTLAVAKRMFGKTWGLRPSMTHWLYTRVVLPSITYGAAVWWPKVMQEKTRQELSKIQRMACLGITGAMKTTPTEGMETLLDLPPLDAQVLAAARTTFHRLQWQNQIRIHRTDSGISSIWKQVSDPILDMRSDCQVSGYNITKNFEVITDQNKNGKKHNMESPNKIIWYTNGTKKDGVAGAGICGLRPEVNKALSLGIYATIFQAEIYAILWCVQESIRRGYMNTQILITTHNQSALLAIKAYRVRSRLVQECLQHISELACYNQVKLIWQTGDTEGHQLAAELARQGTASRPIGPEPIVGVTKGMHRLAIGEWIRVRHTESWRTCHGNGHGKTIVKGPRKDLAEELLSLSRNQLRLIVGLITGHAPVKYHLVKIKVLNEAPDCRLCMQEVETVEHILCKCSALARRRQRILGSALVDLRELSNVPIKDLLILIKGTGIGDWC